MALTTTKTTTKDKQLKKKKSFDDKKTKESPKKEIKPKGKAKEHKESTKKKPTKALALAPPPDSDADGTDGDDEGDVEEKPKKTTKSEEAKPKTVSPKQPPKQKLISANANAKIKAPSTKHDSKKQKKAKSPTPASPVISEADNAEEEGDDHLHGFSTDNDDSSDEDIVADEGLSLFEISKLPTIAKDDESVKRKLDKAKRQTTEDRGVVYIGRLPHGFYEDQLRGYFSQFGDITRLRISRNKKTGKCKHYGFIEFSSSSVAQIVAETMDNYLLTGHILKCKLIPKDEVHPELWVGANRKWRVVPRDRIVREQHNKPKTEEGQEKATRRLLKRQNERKRKLEALGIEYDFDSVGYKKVKKDAET